MNIKNLVIALLLVSYALSCAASLIFAQKQVTGTFRNITMGDGSGSPNLPTSPPKSTEESSDIEDNFSEDEHFAEVSRFSILPTLDPSHFYFLNNPPVHGSLSPPFSPPEVKII